MKKIMLFAAVAMLFVACGKNTKANEEAQDSTQVECCAEKECCKADSAACCEHACCEHAAEAEAAAE